MTNNLYDYQPAFTFRVKHANGYSDLGVLYDSLKSVLNENFFLRQVSDAESDYEYSHITLMTVRPLDDSTQLLIKIRYGS